MLSILGQNVNMAIKFKAKNKQNYLDGIPNIARPKVGQKMPEEIDSFELEDNSINKKINKESLVTEDEDKAIKSAFRDDELFDENEDYANYGYSTYGNDDVYSEHTQKIVDCLS